MNCIIGKDYPKPIVDHKEISKINIQKIQKAYAADKLRKGGSGKDDDEEEEEE